MFLKLPEQSQGVVARLLLPGPGGGWQLRTQQPLSSPRDHASPQAPWLMAVVVQTWPHTKAFVCASSSCTSDVSVGTEPLL